jgi:hypothetical protein
VPFLAFEGANAVLIRGVRGEARAAVGGDVGAGDGDFGPREAVLAALDGIAGLLGVWIVPREVDVGGGAGMGR